MAAMAAVQRLKAGSDAILKTVLGQRDRPSHGDVLQAVPERLAAEAMAASKEIDAILEQAKLARTTQSEDDVKREVSCSPNDLLHARVLLFAYPLACAD